MKKIFFLFFLIMTLTVFAKDITIEAFGEAQIINNDIATAKIEAQMRAKWAAMEEAAQVRVSTSSVIHNAELLDEAIKSDVTGSITSFKITDEGRDGDIYWLSAKVTVKPDNAENTMKKLAGNTTIAVITPMQKGAIMEMSHPFGEQLVIDLMDKGFDVVDLNSEYPDLANEIYEAVLQNDMKKVNSLAYKLLAGSVLVGTLDVIDKGKDAGYQQITFTVVDGVFSYRLIGNKDNKKALLYTGSIVGRGQGSNLNTAAMSLSQNMAKRESIQVASTIASKIMGENKKTVRVVLVGNTDLTKLQRLKNDLTNISWVLGIRESGSNVLLVDYAEKTYYLAAIISKATGYTVKSFTDTEIILGS